MRRFAPATYLDATINVERAVVDAETGLRGYVITGQPLFLAPTHSGTGASCRAPRPRSSGPPTHEGAFVARANALADSARSYMTGYVPGVIARGHHRSGGRALGPDDDAWQAARRRHPTSDRRSSSS